MMDVKINIRKNFQKLLFAILLISASGISAQENSEEIKKASSKYMQEAEAALAENNFARAEALYRKAIAKNPENAEAKYNLGNLYYNNKIVPEAAERHSQAAKSAERETLKHKAFHNEGNAFMEQKQYKKAIEAYKNSLRNNPKDDQTRYNLALAKKMLEEQKKKGGGGEDKKDQNKDQNQDKQKKDQQKKQENKGDKKENKDGEPQDKKPGEDKKEGEKDKDEKGKPKDENKKENPSEKGEQKPKQQQPVPGQLSPQQIKNLLEAMSNEEKKVREKINAKKTKGSRVKTEKDW